MSNLLILDATYLCRRNFYSRGGGSKTGGLVNGTIYGMFMDIINLQQIHQSDAMVFCFDHGKSHRYKLLPTYKKGGKKNDWRDYPENRMDVFLEELNLLKTTILTSIGFRNVFYVDGFEADDLIGSICKNNLSEETNAVIVSSDKDFYQLLAPNISMWVPVKNIAYTMEDFTKEYRITPAQWIYVKSIAGCTSDNIPGVQGVGEITAVKYLRKELPEKLPAYKAIQDKWPLVLRNKRLVSLPFENTPTLSIMEDRITDSKWRTVMKEFGMESLRLRAPVFC